jgi:hypothetical protein
MQASRAPAADAVPEPAASPTVSTSLIAGPQRAVPGSTPGWLATRTLPEIQDNKAGTSCWTRAARQLPEDNVTQTRAAASSRTPHYAQPGDGSDTACAG